MAASDITPALCALADGLAYRVVEDNVDAVRKLLEAESLLYRNVFLGFTYARHASLSKPTMREFLCTQLRNESLVKAPEGLVCALSSPVHDEYWQMAGGDCFWRNGQRGAPEDLFDYSDLLEIWADQSKTRLASLTKLVERLQQVLK